MAAIVVAPNAQNDSAVGQYDISYQLAEIEVKCLHVALHLHLYTTALDTSWLQLRQNARMLLHNAVKHHNIHISWQQSG